MVHQLLAPPVPKMSTPMILSTPADSPSAVLSPALPPVRGLKVVSPSRHACVAVGGNAPSPLLFLATPERPLFTPTPEYGGTPEVRSHI